jgi:hypothetical protein
MLGLSRRNLPQTSLFRKNTTLARIGKLAFLIAGLIGAFFSLNAGFLLPAVVDLTRLIVAALFASLATNAFLLSGAFFQGSSERHCGPMTSVFRTPPVIISAFLFLLLQAVLGGEDTEHFDFAQPGGKTGRHNEY